MKKFLSLFLSCVMLFSMATFASAEDAGVTIEYPDTLQAMGFSEPIVLDKMPTRVVVMSTAPVLALYELDVNMIAIPKTSVVTWPEDLTANAEQLSVTMNANFDIETVVAMEPDLVIMGYTSQDTYGVTLEALDIPVYYVDAGHTVSYESIKAQTQILIEDVYKRQRMALPDPIGQCPFFSIKKCSLKKSESKRCCWKCGRPMCRRFLQLKNRLWIHRRDWYSQIFCSNGCAWPKAR